MHLSHYGVFRLAQLLIKSQHSPTVKRSLIDVSYVQYNTRHSILEFPFRVPNALCTPSLRVNCKNLILRCFVLILVNFSFIWSKCFSPVHVLEVCQRCLCFLIHRLDVIVDLATKLEHSQSASNQENCSSSSSSLTDALQCLPWQAACWWHRAARKWFSRSEDPPGLLSRSPCCHCHCWGEMMSLCWLFFFLLMIRDQV